MDLADHGCPTKEQSQGDAALRVRVAVAQEVAAWDEYFHAAEAMIRVERALVEHQRLVFLASLDVAGEERGEKLSLDLAARRLMDERDLAAVKTSLAQRERRRASERRQAALVTFAAQKR